MILVRLIALGVLSHEVLYLFRDGKQYLTLCFLPTMGLNLTPALRTALHVSLVAVGVALLVLPQLWPLYPALLVLLTLSVASTTFRLSNHLIVALMLALLLCLDLFFQPPGWTSYRPTAFLYAGAQATAVVVYLLAFFHKLNADFLSKERSCGAHSALLFLRDRGIDNKRLADVYSKLAIHGTLVIEFAIPFLLLFPRTRALGLCLAVVFHAQMGFLIHLHFSCIMYAALAAFVPPEAWRGLMPEMTPGAWAAVALLLALGALGGWRLGVVSSFRHRRGGRGLQMFFGAYTAAALGVAALLLYGGSVPTFAWGELGAGEWVVLGLAFSLFLLNGLAPYLGLKTEFSIAMFSNLRHDPWTHLLVPARWRPFDLSSYVRVERIEGLPPAKGHPGGVAAQAFLKSMASHKVLLYSSYYFHDGLELVCRTSAPAPVIKIAYVERGVRHETDDYARDLRTLPRRRYIRATLFPFAMPADPSTPFFT